MQPTGRHVGMKKIDHSIMAVCKLTTVQENTSGTAQRTKTMYYLKAYKDI